MKKLSSEDRSTLIRLASSLPKGSPEKKAILSGLAQRKTAGWVGGVYIQSARDPESHKDFARVLKWAERATKNKKLIDNNRSPSTAPFDRAKISATRDGRLTFGLSGNTTEALEVPGKTTFDRSIGGDHIVPFTESGSFHDDVAVDNYVEVEESKRKGWEIRWAREIGVHGTGQDFSGEISVGGLAEVLRKLPTILRKFYR